MSDTVDPFTDLVLEVFRLNGQLLASGDRLSAPVGLTSARWQVLGSLAGDPQTVARIARGMGLTRQSVQRTVDVLVGEGLLDLHPNPDHKRARLVCPTERGRKTLEAITALQRQWAAETARDLSPDDLAAATTLLRLIRQRLEHDTDQPE